MTRFLIGCAFMLLALVAACLAMATMFAPSSATGTLWAESARSLVAATIMCAIIGGIMLEESRR